MKLLSGVLEIPIILFVANRIEIKTLRVFLRKMGRKKVQITIDDCRKFAESQGGKCLSTEFTSTTKNMKWSCEKGHVFLESFNSVRDGFIGWCLACTTFYRKITPELCEDFANRHGGKLLSLFYSNSKANTEWECARGHRWKGKIDSFSGFEYDCHHPWCKRCEAKESYDNRVQPQWLQEIYIETCNTTASLKGGRCISTSFPNRNTKLDWICKNGHMWCASYSSVVDRGTWCPKCKNKTEGMFSDFLQRYFGDFCHQAKFDWCKNPETNRHLPFDFCIESKKVLIEVDGPQHFKQVMNWDSPENQKKRDLFKIQKALENGYSVMRILQEVVYSNCVSWQIETLRHLSKIPFGGLGIPRLELIMMGEEYKKHFKMIDHSNSTE